MINYILWKGFNINIIIFNYIYIFDTYTIVLKFVDYKKCKIEMNPKKVRSYPTINQVLIYNQGCS